MNIDHSFDHSSHEGFVPHHDQFGNHTGTHIENAFGGKDYLDSHGQFVGSTSHNIFGGTTYHGTHGEYLGGTMPGTGLHGFHGDDGNLHHSPSFLHSDHINSMRADLLGRIR
jgi:hypothetical protein